MAVLPCIIPPPGTFTGQLRAAAHTQKLHTDFQIATRLRRACATFNAYVHFVPGLSCVCVARCGDVI